MGRRIHMTRRRAVLAGGTLAMLAAVGGPGQSHATPLATAERAEQASHLDYMPTVQRAAQERRDCVLPVVIAVECVGVGTPMVYNSGPVLTAPKIYVVRWGWSTDPSGEATYQQNFLTQLGGSSWFNSQTQYCQSTNLLTLVSCNAGDQFVGNQAGMFSSSTNVWADSTNAVPTNPTDADIQAEAKRAATHFGNSTAASNTNTQYIIDTPKGNSTIGFATSWCSYHGAAIDPTLGEVFYTDFPYITDAGASCGANFISGPLDGVSIVGGHEFAETATDPVPGHGWTDATGAETGDKCAWISIGPGSIAVVNGWPVQSLWSNAANSGVGGCAQ